MTNTDHELGLAVLHRNSLARAMHLRTAYSGRGPAAARTLRFIDQLGASIAAGLAHRPAADPAADLQRLLAEAARRVRERAMKENSPPRREDAKTTQREE